MATAPRKDKKEYLVSELGKAFLKTSAFRIGDFQTSTGTKTPYYVDLSRVSSFPNVFSLALECIEYELSEISKKNSVDVICGVPMTGLIISAALAGKLSKPLVHAPHGNDRKIIGMISSGANVLVIDDVSETGKTIELSVLASRANGGVVNDALTLVDRGEGAKKDLAKLQVTLHSFTTVHELAKRLRDNMSLSDEEESILDNIAA